MLPNGTDRLSVHISVECALIYLYYMLQAHVIQACDIVVPGGVDISGANTTLCGVFVYIGFYIGLLGADVITLVSVREIIGRT